MAEPEDIDHVIGPSATRTVSDIAAQQWLNELKARPNQSPAEVAMVEELDAAAKDQR
jgi:hypothetical protein